MARRRGHRDGSIYQRSDGYWVGRTLRHAAALAKVPLAKLSPLHLQRLYADRLAAGLAPRTVQCLHAILHRALAQAVRWRRVVPLPASGSMTSATRMPACYWPKGSHVLPDLQEEVSRQVDTLLRPQ